MVTIPQIARVRQKKENKYIKVDIQGGTGVVADAPGRPPGEVCMGMKAPLNAITKAISN